MKLAQQENTHSTDYLAFGTPDFSEEEIAAVARVMRSGWVGMGPETELFEQELANFVGAPSVIAVNSCTSALFLSLLVEGVGPGDEVIVPSLTWVASANVILYLGATPVFCDIDANTMCVSERTIKDKITDKTKAVVVVHYGGFAVDTQALKERIPNHIVIIEDAAHALGACYSDGKPLGSSGNICCFSFYANKNLSTADGGAIALFDEEKAERLRSLRMSGLASNAWLRYTSNKSAPLMNVQELGFKMNYTDLQASIGRVQLRRQGSMANIRHATVDRYLSKLNEAGFSVQFQKGVSDKYHARHLLVGRFTQDDVGMTRNELLQLLRDRNIGASIHYSPLHLQEYYRNYCQDELPVTEALSSEILTLPIGPLVGKNDVDYVVSQLIDIVSQKKHKGKV